MPFAAVLTRSSCCFCLRQSRFHARKGISGSGLCPVTMLRHLANLQARIHPVKESRFFIYERSAASMSVIIVVLHSGMHRRHGQRLPCAGHLLTVEMLSSLARDGHSHDSTSHENSFIHSRICAHRDSFAKSPPRATCSREDRAAAPASFCRARRAKRRVYANP